MEKNVIEDVYQTMLDTQKDKYLTFMLGDTCYAIEIALVTEIIGIQPITQVPEMPEYIKGIINLRGKIIPVMDVRIRFKKPSKEYTDRTCIIVVEANNVSIGFIVDSVAEVLDIPEADTVIPPVNVKARDSYIKFIGKVGKAVKLILDCDQLLDNHYFEDIATINEEGEI